ncbi:MAG: signal peptidase I [Nitrososphaerota archaeon]|nr:signal peptidase I [Nitrososphaerota archaeon]
MQLRKAYRYGSYATSAVLFALVLFAAVDYSMGTPPFYVVSDSPSSMYPTVDYGWAVVVFRVPFDQVHNGSIIVFHDPRGNPTLIVHRVVAINSCGGSPCFETQGDNRKTNPTPDPWNVTRQDYVGEVVAIAPYAGYLAPTFWGFSGVYRLLPVLFVILLVALVVNVRRTRSERREEAAGEAPPPRPPGPS